MQPDYLVQAVWWQTLCLACTNASITASATAAALWHIIAPQLTRVGAARVKFSVFHHANLPSWNAARTSCQRGVNCCIRLDHHLPFSHCAEEEEQEEISTAPKRRPEEESLAPRLVSALLGSV